MSNTYGRVIDPSTRGWIADVIANTLPGAQGTAGEYSLSMLIDVSINDVSTYDALLFDTTDLWRNINTYDISLMSVDASDYFYTKTEINALLGLTANVLCDGSVLTFTNGILKSIS